MTGWQYRVRRSDLVLTVEIGSLSKGHLMPDLYTDPDKDRTPFKGRTEGLARPRAGECNASSVRLYGSHTALLPGDALTTPNSPDRGAVGRGPAALRALIPGGGA